MDQIPVSKFKSTCLRTLSRIAKSGRSVLVTKRGRPLAVVSPPPSARRKTAAFGCLRHRMKIVGDIVAPIKGVRWKAFSE